MFSSVSVAAVGLVVLGIGIEMAGRFRRLSWFQERCPAGEGWRKAWERVTARRRQQRARMLAEAQLPLLVEHLVLGGQAGLSLQESLAAARKSVPRPLSDEVDALLDLVAVGHSLRSALTDRTSSAQGSLRRLLEQLLTGEELGIALEEILVRESQVLTEIEIHRQEARISSLSLATSLLALVLLFPPLILLVLVPNVLVFMAGW